MASESKRAEIEDSLPPPQAKRPCLGNLDVNPANDRSDQQVWSTARVHPEESGGWLVLAPTERVLNEEYPTGDGVCSSSDHADQEVSRVVVPNQSTVKLLLNVCYPVQVRILSSLDRTDFRSMQLAGLGLRISRIMQRLHLIPIPCSNSKIFRPEIQSQDIRPGFLTRVGWLPETTCDNTTATMDEIKPCTGMVWFSNFCPGTTDDIDACREPHLDVTGKEVKGSSHNTCLECFLSAERRMTLLEQRRIPRLRRTLCSKHTRKNTPQAQNKPCKCLEILSTEWRCWSCRRSTLRGLSGIAMMRKKALDEGRYDNDDDQNGNEDGDHGDDTQDGDDGQDSKDDEDGQHGDDGQDDDDQYDYDGQHDADGQDDDGQYDDDGQHDADGQHDDNGQDGISDEDDGERSDANDSEDRDMRDERIPKDGPHFCPLPGCNMWITPQEQEAAKLTGGALTMCLACQTILLPSEEEDEGDIDDDDDDYDVAYGNGGAGESDFEEEEVY